MMQPSPLVLRVLRLTVAALSLAAASALSGQTTFTFTGTISTAAGGFTLNEPVTISITTNAAFSANSNSSHFHNPFSPFNNVYNWEQLLGTSDVLPASTFVTGLGSRSDYDHTTAADLQVEDIPAGTLNFFVGDQSTNFGSYISASSDLTDGTAFVVPTTFISPDVYFADYVGTHSAAGSVTIQQGAVATISSVTISVGAIPEPDTCAILCGVAVLGFAVVRRRSRS